MQHGSSMVRKRAPHHRPRFLCVRSKRRPDRPDSRSYVASWLVSDGMAPKKPAAHKAARGEPGLQLFSKGKAKVARGALASSRPRAVSGALRSVQCVFGRFEKCTRCGFTAL